LWVHLALLDLPALPVPLALLVRWVLLVLWALLVRQDSQESLVLRDSLGLMGQMVLMVLLVFRGLLGLQAQPVLLALPVLKESK
jgi:hypothetical protein